MCDHSEVTFYTKSTECGTDSRLAPHVLMADLQETADKGADDTGWGREAIGRYGCCWIILRCRLKFTDLPAWKDGFTVKTWTCGVNKLFFDREYEICDKNGNVIGRSTSVWIVAEKETHRPVFPSKLEDLPQDFAQSDRLSLGEPCPKLKIPDRGLYTDDPLIIKYADYSELDHNHHVNNTRYVAWIYDALYKSGVDVHRINDININYISEVRAGEKIEIFASEADNGMFIAGFKDGDRGVFASRVGFCI